MTNRRQNYFGTMAEAPVLILTGLLMTVQMSESVHHIAPGATLPIIT
ncbi:MAG: hypothetical protein ACUVSY_13145 [Roseiflexus sp.]